MLYSNYFNYFNYFAFWSIFNIYLINSINVNSNKLNLYESVIINSLVHCSISSISTILFLLKIINDGFYKIFIVYNIVYFGYDSYLYISNKIPPKDKKIMLFHHTLLFLAAFYGFKDTYYYARCLLCEVSTIFLNLRWLAYKKIYFQNVISYSILLYISFIFFRIINISILVYEFYIYKEKLYLVVASIFLILNIYWTYLLTLKALSMIKQK